MEPNSVPAPAELHARIRAHLAGELTPVRPRDAATVVLLRDDPGAGLVAYVLRRAASMAFAGGYYSFVGGGVDPNDARLAADVWAGPPPEIWARRFGCDEALARALVCAAVRETYEESGVLLAGPDEHSVVGAEAEAWDLDRRALLDRTLTLDEFLRAHGLLLRSDLLGAWSRWITPSFEARRYDTAFFVAALPAGQVPRDVSGEADGTAWLPVADFAGEAAGEGSARGEAAGKADTTSEAPAGPRPRMLPPTAMTLRQLADHTTVAEVLASAAARRFDPTEPRARAGANGDYLLEWS